MEIAGCRPFFAFRRDVFTSKIMASGDLFQVMNKAKVAAGGTRKSNSRRRNGMNGTRLDTFNPKTEAALQKSKKTLEKLIQQRNIARDLHKEEIDAAGFLLALEHLADRQIWKTSCRLDLRTEVNIEDDNVASQLYRILREALINANKHARATQIVLEVRRVKNHLVFSVSDNGVGFSRKSKAGHGLGFHIMQYRVQSIGASLEFESLKKRGSRVACYLPFTLQK